MLALFESRFGAWLIILVMLALAGSGLYLHLRATANTLVELRQQVALLQTRADQLQAARDALQADVNNIADAQATALIAMDHVRQQSALLDRTIRARKFTAGNDTATQAQINAEMADAFKRLEDASHAP